MDLSHMLNMFPFFLAWWGLSLVLILFVLTVLLGCVMIIGMVKWIWRLIRPKKYYEPNYD